MSACPECGGPAIRQGTKARRVLDLGPDGAPALGTTRVQRWQCARCGLFFSTGVDAAKPRSLVTAAARDAIAEACFEAGYAAAAQRFGVDEKTARAMWDEWAAPRERALPARVPEYLGLHTVSIAGVDRTVVTDVDAMAVVDVLRGSSAADVVAWLDGLGPPGRVDTVALAVHQPFREAARSRLPGARLVVCPDHAAASGLRAFLHALRSMRRVLGRGVVRNVREAPRTFAKREGALTPGEREEMTGWDDDALALYEAKERFLEALACARAGEARFRLTAVRSECLFLGGAGAPVALIENWGAEMALGAGETALPLFTAALAEVALRWAARRPVLPYDLARGLAVLRDGPRVFYDDPETGEAELAASEGSETGAAAVRGVDMRQVAQALVSRAAA